MLTLTEVATENQSTEKPIERKVGIEIVRSVNLPRNFFDVPRRGFWTLPHEDEWKRRIAKALKSK